MTRGRYSLLLLKAANMLSAFRGKTGGPYPLNRNLRTTTCSYSLNGANLAGDKKKEKRWTAACCIIRWVIMAPTMAHGCGRRNSRWKRATAAITGELPGAWLIFL